MSTKLERVEEQFQVKRYKIQYPISAYTFPREARIHQVRFDDKYMHVELTDGRALSVPLSWIPTLHNALPKEREKYELSRDRTMIIWDPEKCAINDEVRIADYMEPSNSANHLTEQTTTERR
ncbi:MAG: DUF2442 domain-containing protein [Chloroflexi bacterium]|nr:DUF2442 domain-containing protein [Chloroflexota bacterium]